MCFTLAAKNRNVVHFIGTWPALDARYSGTLRIACCKRDAPNVTALKQAFSICLCACQLDLPLIRGRFISSCLERCNFRTVCLHPRLVLHANWFVCRVNRKQMLPTLSQLRTYAILSPCVVCFVVVRISRIHPIANPYEARVIGATRVEAARAPD